MLTLHSAARLLLQRETLWVEVVPLKPPVAGGLETTLLLPVEVKLLGEMTLLVAAGRALQHIPHHLPV